MSTHLASRKKGVRQSCSRVERRVGHVCLLHVRESWFVTLSLRKLGSGDEGNRYYTFLAPAILREQIGRQMVQIDSHDEECLQTLAGAVGQ